MCTTSSLSFAQELVKETELAALDAEIQLVMDKYKIPSVTFAIMSQVQPLHLRAYGMTNKDANIKASITTQYRIASISKMIVSIAVMQLVESGELSLDDKIADILPDLTFSNRWSKTHPLQLAHILESTTGWDGISLKEFAYDNNPPLDLKTSLAINPNSRESRWPPGTRHAYNNSAATVAALIVENITGKSFFSYAEQHIFRPLG
ncbi:MAG: serine hydrolase domain-containing protein, partial [Paraglaciecola sp.]|uniref:serine hydrolase domain-containing protein n=1 Tax=Paraglaciecola sp. TaxID=1920173 RepID=UPI003299188E